MDVEVVVEGEKSHKVSYDGEQHDQNVCFGNWLEI